MDALSLALALALFGVGYWLGKKHEAKRPEPVGDVTMLTILRRPRREWGHDPKDEFLREQVYNAAADRIQFGYPAYDPGRGYSEPVKEGV